MNKPIGEMTAEELREVLGELVESKLIEILGDPDQDLELRDTLRQRLDVQHQAVAHGERGESLDEVARRLDVAVNNETN
jgi:hypothetical protein